VTTSTKTNPNEPLMRRPFATAAAVIITVTLAGGAFAVWPAKSPPSQNCGSYINRDGHEVLRPCGSWGDPRPARATARCADGTWSFSEHSRGTCSHHGGVAR